MKEVGKQYIKYLGEMRPLDEVISVDGFSETEILDEVSKFYFKKGKRVTKERTEISRGNSSIASNASSWRGYEYYEGKKDLSWKQTGEHEFEGEVSGSEKEPYHVIIDTEHPKKIHMQLSTCRRQKNCM